MTARFGTQLVAEALNMLPVKPSVIPSVSAAVCVLMCFASLQVMAVDYESDLKPLLRNRCYSCHGALRQEADLRLDTVAAMLSGGVVVRHNASASLIIERVSADDPEQRMPPEHEAEPLSVSQIDLLAKWIDSGAVAPQNEQPDRDPRDHWAFRPIVRPPVPNVDNSDWSRNPIDAFVAARHLESGIKPQSSASARQRLRRLTFDVIGLPPTPEQLELLESESSAGWYQQTVDRLLTDPRHGERWARHWMDIWRYSDWWGLGDQLRRSQLHIWHWRDWIIESLNANKPYDQMIREMLAADELFPNDQNRLRATGFLARNFNLFNRQHWLDETVEHVGKSLLGLTFNCAKCHDHKFDPIAQTDYYRMKAFFEPYMARIDMVPGEPDVNKNGIPCVFDALPNAPTYRLERGQENHPDTSKQITPGLPVFLGGGDIEVSIVKLPHDSWETARRPWVLETHLASARQQLARTRKKESNLRETANIPVGQPPSPSLPELRIAELATKAAETELRSRQCCVAAMQSSWDTQSSRTPKLKRAAIEAQRTAAVAEAKHAIAVAERDFEKATDKVRDSAQKKLETARKQLETSRAKAAEEISDSDSFVPLTGTRWTPTRFTYSGKDDTHPGFPSHSTGRRTALARWITDSSNPLTARVAVNHVWNRHMGQPLAPTVFDFGRNGTPPTHVKLLDWLAAELIHSNWDLRNLHRLILTSQTYQLSSSAENNSVATDEDPDNLRWWRRTPLRLESQAIRDSVLAHAGILDDTRGGPVVEPKDQAASRRRSLYFFHSHNDRNLMLTTFDEASVNECYRRETSIVPQQALALSNSRLVRDSSVHIARRLHNGSPLTDPVFIDRAFRLLLGTIPSEEESARCQTAMNRWRQLPDTSDEDVFRLAVWVLMNHNDFVTIR
ncbi:MAG: DUF1553 domain-containing protein [Fuerstiella sp.]|nr:DUF1553 domain-containing protein [Fuerstiella sp.]